MKTSLRILLSVLAITSTMAFAGDPADRLMALEKFSYQGIGFKDSKADLIAKRFECDQYACNRDENDTRIKVVFTGDRIQIVDSRTRYANHLDCEANQNGIKKFLTDTYNFEYVNQDSTFLGITLTSKAVGGTINTTDGSILVNVSCMNDPKINKGYVNSNFNLKDISYQNFKDAFKYE